MSTLGDPLADVGLFLLYWGQSEAQIIATGQAIDEQAGFASRDEIVELYAKESGRPVDNLDFYVVFAFYKLAIIVEGIAARYRMGKTLGEGFEHMGQMVKSLVDEALEQANRSSIPALRG
jgi:aminoglycoside phosphotransferase (APT) family kinase protein